MSKSPIEQLENRRLLTLLGDQLFPADNAWNQNIANAPVAANSAAVMNNIITEYGNGRFHPDFGQDSGATAPLYGIPINVVHGNTQPFVQVVLGSFKSESDVQNAPIPLNAVLEGDNQNGPVVGLSKRGDSHLIVWDEDHNIAYEFYHASRPSENTDGQWHAAQESVWDMTKNTFRTIDWTSADAAGLAILPGLARPDEGLPVSEGGQGVINHALRFTLQNDIILNQFLYPASHVANPGNTSPALQPPMGARFRLKANVDISQLNPESKVIAQTLKTYGLIVADNGSNFFMSGASYSVDASNNRTLTWNDNDIQDTVHGLKSLTYSDFEMVDLTPVVTGLSATSGTAGSTLTLIGQNFSGAAGHLQVLFGGAAATNVSVVDDSHVSVTIPPGSGTVDVRVQSGTTIPADPENVESTIFGYGISGTSASDRFTYASANLPPAPPAPVLEAGSDTGISQSDGITAATTLVFDLTATLLSGTLELYRDGQLVGSQPIGSHETATITDNGPVPQGGHTYTAKQVDTSNNRSPASNGLTVTVVTTPPPTATVALNPADDSGASNSDGITNLARPRFQISGAVAGDQYDLLGAGGTVLASATAAGATLTLQPASNLPSGLNTVQVRGRDVAGNTSLGGTATVVIDTTAPSPPSLTLLPTDDTGVAGDGKTRVRRPHFTGQTEPHATISLVGPGGGVLGTAMASATGSFSVQPTAALSAGTIVLQATATDVAGNTSAAGPGLTITILPAVVGDIDGDGKTDVGVYGYGRFAFVLSAGGYSALTWGGPADQPVLGDFNGDGQTDLGVYGYGRFAIALAGGGHLVQPVGTLADRPVVGDFFGDGQTDLAVYGSRRFLITEPGTSRSMNISFGGPLDTPVVGDFFGDGKADLGVWGPYGPAGAERFAVIEPGTSNLLVKAFGGPADQPVVGDFFGDGKDDLAVYGYGRLAAIEPGTNRTLVLPIGQPLDQPVVGDDFGDGKSDIGVWGPYGPSGSQRFMIVEPGTSQTMNVRWGGAADVPVPPVILARPVAAMATQIVRTAAAVPASLLGVPLVSEIQGSRSALPYRPTRERQKVVLARFDAALADFTSP